MPRLRAIPHEPPGFVVLVPGYASPSRSLRALSAPSRPRKERGMHGSKRIVFWSGRRPGVRVGPWPPPVLRPCMPLLSGQDTTTRTWPRAQWPCPPLTALARPFHYHRDFLSPFHSAAEPARSAAYKVRLGTPADTAQTCRRLPLSSCQCRTPPHSISGAMSIRLTISTLSDQIFPVEVGRAA